MNEAIEWLKLYMDNNKTGNKVTDKYLEVVNALIESSIQLQQENTQLKQQLKETNNCLNLQIANVTLLEKELNSKEEKISKIEKYCKDNIYEFYDEEYGEVTESVIDGLKILEILESNEED